jgi:hypothetical protein
MLSNNTVKAIASRLQILTIAGVIVWTNVKGRYSTSYDGDKYEVTDTTGALYINGELVAMNYNTPALKEFNDFLVESQVGAKVVNKLEEAVLALELLYLLDELAFELLLGDVLRGL